MNEPERHEAARYVPSVHKALEVVLWLSDKWKGIDLYHLVKAAFFADRVHVARYGRPISGDDYRAAPFGPLPQVIYGLLRDQPIERLALGNNGPLPFKMDERYCVFPDREPNLAHLSESDIEALEIGLESVRGKSFDQLFLESHAEPSYRRAIAGQMDYREFIPDDDPERAEKQAFIEESAPYAVL